MKKILLSYVLITCGLQGSAPDNPITADTRGKVGFYLGRPGLHRCPAEFLNPDDHWLLGLDCDNFIMKFADDRMFLCSNECKSQFGRGRFKMPQKYKNKSMLPLKYSALLPAGVAAFFGLTDEIKIGNKLLYPTQTTVTTQELLDILRNNGNKQMRWAIVFHCARLLGAIANNENTGVTLIDKLEENSCNSFLGIGCTRPNPEMHSDDADLKPSDLRDSSAVRTAEKDERTIREQLQDEIVQALCEYAQAAISVNMDKDEIEYRLDNKTILNSFFHSMVNPMSKMSRFSLAFENGFKMQVHKTGREYLAEVTLLNESDHKENAITLIRACSTLRNAGFDIKNLRFNTLGTMNQEMFCRKIRTTKSVIISLMNPNGPASIIESCLGTDESLSGKFGTLLTSSNMPDSLHSSDDIGPLNEIISALNEKNYTESCDKVASFLEGWHLHVFSL